MTAEEARQTRIADVELRVTAVEYRTEVLERSYRRFDAILPALEGELRAGLKSIETKLGEMQSELQQLLVEFKARAGANG